MDTKKIQLILNKAVNDKNFATALQVDLIRAVSSYNLNREELNSVQSGLNDLISRGLVVDKNGQL